MFKTISQYRLFNLCQGGQYNLENKMKINTSCKTARLSKWLWPIIAGAALLFAGAAQAVIDEPLEAGAFGAFDPVYLDGGTTPLIADGGNDEGGPGDKVGDVTWVPFYTDDDPPKLKLKVTFNVDSPEGGNWCMTKAHLAVAEAAYDDKGKNYPDAGIPQTTKKGNPIPGQFVYTELFDCATKHEFVVDIDNCGELVIAAHANVKNEMADLAALSDLLPDQATISVKYPSAGDPSYFLATISNAGDLNGEYLDWCVDLDNTIGNGTSYTCNLYSSYDDNLDGVIDVPGNLDLVNWIINQGYVYQASGCSGTTYTYGDVQRAIWTLIDDELSTSGLGQWSQCRVDEILAGAALDGVDFEPACSDFIAIICQPVNAVQVTIAQVTVFEFGLDVCREETAWGWGPQFTTKKWATYMGEMECPDLSWVPDDWPPE
jgi:hypothetical protein